MKYMLYYWTMPVILWSWWMNEWNICYIIEIYLLFCGVDEWMNEISLILLNYTCYLMEFMNEWMKYIIYYWTIPVILWSWLMNELNISYIIELYQLFCGVDEWMNEIYLILLNYTCYFVELMNEWMNEWIRWETGPSPSSIWQNSFIRY